MDKGMYKIKKKSQPTAHTGDMDLPSVSAKIGRIGPDIPSAKMGSNMQISATLKGAKKGATAAQRDKLEGEVSLGPTEVSETRRKYLDRMSKRK